MLKASQLLIFNCIGKDLMLTKAYVSASNFFHSFKNDERGVTAIEYGLIAVAMAVLVTTAVGDGGFINELEDAFDKVATAISTAGGKEQG